MVDVESLASSLVREYLSRKSLKETLSMLDKELPRTDSCVNNRAQLAKELHINGLMKKNKESGKNFRTMLEVMVKFMAAKAWVKQSSIEGQGHIGESSKTISPREHEYKSESLGSSKEKAFVKGRQELQSEKQKVCSQGNELTDDFTLSASSELHVDHLSFSEPGGHKRSQKVSNRTTLGEEWTSDLELDRSVSLPSNKKNADLLNEWDVIGTDKRSSHGRVRNNVNREGLGFSKDNFGKQSHQKNSFSKKEVLLNENMRSDQTHDYKNVHNKNIQPSGDSLLLKQTSNFGAKSSQRNTRNISGSMLSTGLHNPRKYEKTKYMKECLTEDFDRQYGEQNISRNATTSKDDNIDNSILNVQEPNIAVPKKESKDTKTDWKKEIIENKESRKNDHLKQPTSIKNDELIFEDVDDNFDEELNNLHLDISRTPAISSTQNRPITLQNARDLKSIIFGSSFGVFNQEWRNQGFFFSTYDYLKYGIVQHKGGPCGLLASVQAVVLKHLLFADHNGAKLNLKFSSEDTINALCSALSEIIWRAGGNKRAHVTLRSEKDQFIASASYKPDRLTEKLLIYDFYNHSELKSFLKENISRFTSNVECGSILLLYSVILSRSIEKITEDMDDPRGTLMGAHGYCTQDMVNLLLTGKAVSNTFDDVIELDAGGKTKNILKGLDRQSDIGLLSLFEYYKSCIVGSHFKNPRYPIWVVCSESHFSVLFSLKRNLLNERRSQKRFDLYYFDGLARQDEEIRLTVDTTTERVDTTETSHDLIPPLELCIRTKWKDGVVDWNGTEPLL